MYLCNLYKHGMLCPYLYKITVVLALRESFFCVYEKCFTRELYFHSALHLDTTSSSLPTYTRLWHVLLALLCYWTWHLGTSSSSLFTTARVSLADTIFVSVALTRSIVKFSWRCHECVCLPLNTCRPTIVYALYSDGRNLHSTLVSRQHTFTLTSLGATQASFFPHPYNTLIYLHIPLRISIVTTRTK